MKHLQNLNMKQPVHVSQLFIMIGAPRSGTSTFARKRFTNARHISREEIRFSVLKPDEDYFSKEKLTWKMFIDAIQQAVNDDLCDEIVIDASHLNFPSRRKLTNALDDALVNSWEIYYIYMDTPYDICCQRNDLRTGRANMPHNVIRDMWNKMTIPKFSEHANIKGVWIIRE